MTVAAFLLSSKFIKSRRLNRSFCSVATKKLAELVLSNFVLLTPKNFCRKNWIRWNLLLSLTAKAKTTLSSTSATIRISRITSSARAFSRQHSVRFRTSCWLRWNWGRCDCDFDYVEAMAILLEPRHHLIKSSIKPKFTWFLFIRWNRVFPQRIRG